MKRNLLLFLLFVFALNVNATIVEITGVSSELEMHQDASLKSPVVGKIPFRSDAEFVGGNPGSAAKKEGVWYQVRYHGVEGWVQGDYLIFEFPAQLVITADKPRLFSGSLYSDDDGSYLGLEKGDTILATDQGYEPRGTVRTFVMDGGMHIAMDDCRYVGPTKSSELSRYSHTPFTVRLKLMLIAFLIIVSISFFFGGKYLWGILFTALTFAAEMWYMETTSYNTWFVNPDIVGYIWTFINGLVFLIALLGQYMAVQFSLACFGLGGIIGDWGFRICLVFVMFNPHSAVISYLVLPVVCIISLIRNFRWINIVYLLIGCVGWYWALVGFGEIIDTFRSFFVWAILFIILGSIPTGSVATKVTGEAPDHIIISHTADGTPYYNDSEGHMHTLYESGHLLIDSDGNSFNKDGFKY